ncbi:hypothetical protein LEP1GSC065_1145 [Leptospira kirschneri serovar Sokoine str. RM1]|nr:hypothetical protein LEP1GSC065_1145 [Leptospira kirschneri serovar Sokoine str. RM1]
MVVPTFKESICKVLIQSFLYANSRYFTTRTPKNSIRK